jgi:hypothetical protein
VLDEILQTTWIVENALLDLGGLAFGILGLVAAVDPLVAQHDGETLVEKRHLLQPARHRLGVVDGRLEDPVVGPVGQRRPGLAGRLALAQWVRRLGLLVTLPPHEPISPDLHLEHAGQRVDHAHSDTVQATGDGVGGAIELAAGVQRGEHDLESGTVLHRVHIHRDAPAVIGDPHPTVGEQGDLDLGRVTRHRLVDRVVHYLPDEVVQATLTGGSDVHAGALADSL